MGMAHLEGLAADPAFVGSYGAPTLIAVFDEENSAAPALHCAADAPDSLHPNRSDAKEHIGNHSEKAASFSRILLLFGVVQMAI